MTRRLAGAATVALCAVVMAVISLSVVWGRRYQIDTPKSMLGAAPFVGRDLRDGWDWRFGWGLVGAGVVSAVVSASVIGGWWWRVRLRWTIVASSIGAGAFATLLALTDGTDGVLYGAAHKTEYLSNLTSAPPAAEFVRTFVERIDDYSVHARGHPPGFVLVLKAVDSIGLDGAWPAAMLSVLAAAAVPAAVLVGVWAVVDAGWVRRVAPLMIVAPYGLWMVTSADAVFAAVGAWGVAALAVGLRATAWRAVAAGAASGLLLGGLLFLTYGGATFLLVPLACVVAARRRGLPGIAPTVSASLLAGGAVTLAFAGAGFWWFAGAAATRVEYWDGTAKYRSGTYFGVANLAVALIALGPTTWFGWMRMSDRRMWVLVAGGVAALAAAHLSQYTRGEVERIWLMFYPWIAVAGGAMIAASARLRAAAWVGLQAAVAIVLQAALVSKW